jgi:hypothetical protein
MTSITQLKPLRFKTVDDIKAFPGFLPNHPLKKEDYADHVGYYELADYVQCCLCKKNDKPCGTDHKIGYVIRSKDGNITIIGGCCSKDKFPEKSEFHANSARTRNEVRRLDRVASLVELLQAREANEILLTELSARLELAYKTMQAFKSNLGGSTVRALEVQIKESRCTVFVDTVRYKRWIDVAGEEHKQRKVLPFNIGTLSYANMYKDWIYRDIRNSLSRIRQAYESAARLVQEDPKQSEISSVAAIINDLPAMQHKVADYEQTMQACLGGNLIPLLYLVDDQADRYKSARAILQLQGNSGGKKVAKEWLRNMDDILKSKTNCDEIRVHR